MFEIKKKGVSDGNEEVEWTVIWAVVARVYRSTHSMYRDAVTDGLKTYSRSDHQLKDIRDNQSVGDVDQQEECTVIRSAVVQHMLYWAICINERRIETCLRGLNEYRDQLFSRPRTHS
ncbi:hypothetical protein BDB01DRAFT_840242 [Pilobolus umbonatus]|nr:hypothetical protein BDB01DRAFT_840242 [Pilobolus umbonatus]